MTNNPEHRLQIVLGLPKIKQLLYMDLILLQSSRQIHHRQDYLNQNYLVLFCVPELHAPLGPRCEFVRVFFYFNWSWCTDPCSVKSTDTETFWSMIVPN